MINYQLKKRTLDSADIRNYRRVCLLSFLSITLERAVHNQLTSCLSENYLLDPNQSGFKNGHYTETALLTMTESPSAARASSNSSVLIILNLSLCVWHSQPRNPPLHSGWTWHCWLCSNLIYIIPDKSTPFRSHGMAACLNPAFLKLTLLRRLCDHITWILLPLLCWWHPIVPLFSLILLQHPCCNSHIRMFGRHLRLVSCTSPKTQP